MQGIGNDFVVIDAIRCRSLPENLEKLARAATNRRLGIGGDGLVILDRGSKAPFRMRMLNPDGSESEMCGNAVRCIHRLVHDHGHASTDDFEVETGAGTLLLSKSGTDGVRVGMGTAKLSRGQIPVAGNPDERYINQPILGFEGTAVSLGNPHLVLFVPKVADIDIERWGPQLERHELFPSRINVHFVQVESRAKLIQRTWERGAGVTLACGTGACAAAVAGFETGRSDRSVEVHLPGGNLQIEYTEPGEVFMTGPSELVFEGEFEFAG